MRNNQTIIFKAISIFGMLIALLGLTSVHAQDSSAIYLQRAGVVHDHIYKQFYDSSTQLFKEKTVLRKDERP